MAISVVNFAKGLALGRLSLHAAAKGFYDVQGGTLITPQSLVDEAVAEFEIAKTIVSERAPEVVAGYLTDEYLERTYVERVKAGADELFQLVDFYAGFYYAHLTVIKIWDAPNQIEGGSKIHSEMDKVVWPAGPCPIAGVMTSRELLRDELWVLVDTFDRLKHRSPEESTVALLTSIETITLFIRRLKVDVGMTLSEQVEGGIH